MKKDSEILHYKRGIQFVNQIEKNLAFGKYSKTALCEFCSRCEERLIRRANFSVFDLNNFLLLSCVALMGLNKESIEANTNLKDYKYHINYVCSDGKTMFDKMREQAVGPAKAFDEAILQLYYLEVVKRRAYDFDDKRVINTPYDPWLSVKKYKEGLKEMPNFLYCVRNGFMHSEYSPDMHSEENFLFLNVKNSDYKQFEGTIMMCNFLEFVKFFYSNDAYMGLVDRYFVGYYEDEEFQIHSDKELDRITEITILEIKYINRKANQKKTFENINYGNRFIPYIPGYQVEEKEIALTPEQYAQIKRLIEKYYGQDFYSLSGLEQGDIILMMAKYLISPSSYISEWIMHFYLNVVHITHMEGCVDNPFKGVFALDAVLAVLKSYLVLYRLQNKAFQEVNYNLLAEFTYQYTEVSDYDMYEAFKNKFHEKGITLTEKEFENRYFCEVFRNALAHGNLDVKIEKTEDGEIVHELILKDVYHGKTRQIEIAIEELNVFLESEAFSKKEAHSKEE